MRVSEIHDQSIRRLKALLEKEQSEESKEALRALIRSLEESKNDIKIDFDVDEFPRPRGCFGRCGGGGC